MMRRWLPLLPLLALGVVACERKTSPPAPAPAPGGSSGETITGRERFGWDQAAGSASELSTYRYAIYVDGARSEVADVSCGTTATAAGFACSGRLPALSNGAHTLELATFPADGGTSESGRSAPLRVIVQASTAGVPPSGLWRSGPAGVTTDGLPLEVERLADGLIDPVDSVVAPDGRLFIGERKGRLRVLDPREDRARLVAIPMDVEGGTVLSLALDAGFDRSPFVYLVYATAGERSVYRLARFRLAGRALAERAVLVNAIAPAGEAPAAVLRATRDGRLLLALGTTGTAASWSFEGKLLRFERDGTTPREQDGTPIIAAGFRSPVGLAWNNRHSRGWIVDRVADGVRLSAVLSVPPAVPRVGDAWRMDGNLGSAVQYDGALLPALTDNVLIASEEARAVLRLRPDEERGSRLVATEWLLQDRVGGVRLITTAPDGVIYFCTAEAVGRIVPGGR